MNSIANEYDLANRILGFMLATIAVFAFLDGMQEDGLAYGFVGAVLTVYTPALCWFIAFRRQREKKQSSFSYVGALVVEVI